MQRLALNAARNDGFPLHLAFGMDQPVAYGVVRRPAPMRHVGSELQPQAIGGTVESKAAAHRQDKDDGPSMARDKVAPGGILDAVEPQS